MGLGRVGPEVGCRFGVRPIEVTRGVRYRVSVGGPVCQDSHRRDVVHAVRRYVALLVLYGVVWCGVVWCGVVWCAEGAVTKRQKAGMSTHG